MNERASQFLKLVKLEHSRVQYPHDLVFLCGGLLNESSNRLSSLRDFLHKNHEEIFGQSRIILAERAAAEFDSRIFEDLLALEKQIASISRIVMLVSESPGSIAELGAFSQIDEIRFKLLVFIHSNHYSANSFIKYGPIRYLENANQQSVQEFDWQKNNRGSVTPESARRHLAAFKGAADGFLKGLPQAEGFKIDNVGHCITLIAGIIFTLRCCKLREIVEATKIMGLTFAESQVKQFIFCLSLVGWIKIVKRDVQYHIYTGGRAPIVFRGSGGHSDFSQFDAVRVRYDILQAYRSDDPRLTVLDSVAI